MSNCAGQIEISCKPLTCFICGTSTFLIKRNEETVENCLHITVELKFILKVIKANHILDKLRLNIPFNFTILRSFHLFLQAPF